MGTSLIEYAELEIFKRFGDDVSAFHTRESLRKFGSNPSFGAEEVTLLPMLGSETEETYATDNIIDKIVSDDDNNDQNITINGHTIDDDNNLTFVSQTVTLKGQTEVSLTIPLARAERAVNIGVPLADDSTVYIYEDSIMTLGLPDEPTKVHLSIAAIDNQSSKAAFCTQFNEYFLVTNIFADVNRQTQATVDFRWKTRRLSPGLVRAFTTLIIRSTSDNIDMPVHPYGIIRPNSDILLTAVAMVGNVSVSGGLFGYYARPSGK